MSIVHEPTPKMDKFIKDLVKQRGQNFNEFLVVRGFTTPAGEPRPLTYGECRTLLDEMAPKRPTSHRGRRGARYLSVRCTHEDFPCCGCER